MARKLGSYDSAPRTRASRTDAWAAIFKADPDGAGTIKLANLPHRILAALEADGQSEGVSVQDIVRRHLSEKYPQKTGTR